MIALKGLELDQAETKLSYQRSNFQKIICNSQIGGNWGQEERLQAEVFPFRRKRSFDLLIYCEETKFVVSFASLTERRNRVIKRCTCVVARAL